MRQLKKQLSLKGVISRTTPWVLLVGMQLTLSACLTDVLSKYKAAAPLSESGGKGFGAKASSPGGAARPGIYPIDQGTFRFALSYDRVWNALLDVLLRNYNLAIADRSNGLITTEWDSYYLDGKVHRNKVSLRVKRLTNSGTELTVFNNVEILSKMPDGGITEIWLPTDRNKAEVHRIVQNMAIALNLPKPTLPTEAVAGATSEPPPKM